MAYQRRQVRDSVRRVMQRLADNGGSERVVFSDIQKPGSISQTFVESGKINKTKMKRVLRRIAEKGFIEIKEKRHEIYVSLTTTGLERAARYQVDEIKLEMPTWWDRKWRMVMFDIPEAKKQSRDLFKKKLTELGFVQLQHSVYVHPAESHNEIEFIRTAYGIKENVKMLLVDRIEGESYIRKHFGL